jgi:hypothetical protein
MGSITGLNLNFKKIKINTVSAIFYFALYSGIIIVAMLYVSLFYKSIYFYLKNLINIKLIPLESDFIMFYTSIIFILLILTIIIIPIDLIYSYITKTSSIFNTKYNIQVIFFFIIFGIIGIIYLFLLNNLGYGNIINLTDIYVTSMYLAIYLLILVMITYKIDFLRMLAIPLSSIRRSSRSYKTLKQIKEKDPIIGVFIIMFLVASIIFFGYMYLNFRSFIARYISYYITLLFPWYIVILSFFYWFIIFVIIIKGYFFNKKNFYQSFYKLSKFFSGHLLIFFGILFFVATIDTLNLFLLKNYSIVNILQPTIIEKNLTELRNALVIVYPYMFCYWFYYFACLFLAGFKYYLHYYILPENIGHKADKNENEIKNIQVNPMITILSYLALFIVFLINLML